MIQYKTIAIPQETIAQKSIFPVRTVPYVSETVIIPSNMGVPLTGSLYTPEQPNDRLCIINSATSVRRGFYKGAAEFLRQKGFTVLTYDRQGNGDTALALASEKGTSIPDTDIDITRWGTDDFEGALKWGKSIFPDKQIVTLGHSLGGVIIPQAESSATLVKRAVTVATGAPEPLVGALLRTYITSISPLTGAAPTNNFLGAETPTLVSLEMATFLGQKKFMASDLKLLAKMNEFRAPTLAISPAGDPLSTQNTIKEFHSHWGGKNRVWHIKPTSQLVGGVRIKPGIIGHVGFFNNPNTPHFLGRVASFLLGKIK
ncbi:alpha/beta fold hydrolase [bacterium]|jgi:predicted alpha/beta hydrolase|nr:alpha/beta fold hydrolase [bacterium]